MKEICTPEWSPGNRIKEPKLRTAEALSCFLANGK